MEIKTLLSVIFIIVTLLLIAGYYLMPFRELEFTPQIIDYNFTANGGDISNMQFYPNMRFGSKYISYKIEDCNIRKTEEMIYAFDILENVTVLEFYPVSEDEDLTVTCDEKTRYERGLYIAGEGGPTKVIRSGKYYLILHGNILLLRSSECERPNIAIHELLHTLGFTHSSNENNIMYNFTNCKQTIGDNIPKLINELYEIPSYPDLFFENVSADMHGRYLNMNMSIRNGGLGESRDSLIFIKMGDSILKEVELKSLNIGDGRSISISNIFVSSLGINNLELIIDYPYAELNPDNNKALLEITE
jgi:hypothetical protein